MMGHLLPVDWGYVRGLNDISQVIFSPFVGTPDQTWINMLNFLCRYVYNEYTVDTESIQTPLNFSLFVILQPFAKII